MFNLVKKKNNVLQGQYLDLDCLMQPLYIKLKETIIIFKACRTFFGHLKCINLSVSCKSTCLN